MTKQYRAPLLLLVALTLLFSTAQIVTSPGAVQAGSKVENPAKDMDGDPENYTDGSPGYVGPEKPREIEEVQRSNGVESSPLFVLIRFWIMMILRIPT